MLVSAGLALIAVSVSDLVKASSSKSGTGILKGGFAILFISWVILAIATLFSMKRPTSYSQLTNDKSFRDGTLVRFPLHQYGYELILILYVAAAQRRGLFSPYVSPESSLRSH